MANKTVRKKLSDMREYLKKIIYTNMIIVVAACLFLAGTVSYSYIAKRIADNEWSLSRLRLDTQANQVIEDILTKTLYDTGADRVWVFRFHNGGHFVGGVPYRKLSMSHEKVRRGVSRELDGMQDIPLTAVPEAIELILDNDASFEINVEELPDGYFRASVEDQAIKYMVWHRLMKGESVIGIFGIDYLNDKEKAVAAGANPCEQSINCAARIIEYQIIMSN